MSVCRHEGDQEAQVTARAQEQPVCPNCKGSLWKVQQTGNGMLNEHQFDAVKAGDWYCDKCPSNGRSKTPYCYFWDRELATPTPSARAQEQQRVLAEVERLRYGGKISQFTIKSLEAYAATLTPPTPEESDAAFNAVLAALTAEHERLKGENAQLRIELDLAPPAERRT